MAKGRNTRKKPQIQITGFLENERNTLVQKLKKLGGTYLESTSFLTCSSHIICDKVSRKEKFLCGCASGKWILTANYIHESFKEGCWLDEEQFELTAVKDHSSELSQLENLPRKCREQIHASGKPFSTWRVLLILTPPRQMLFKRLLEAGGARILKGKMPWKGEILRATHFAFVDDQFKKEMSSLLKANVVVIAPEYITEFLIQSPPPSVEIFRKGNYRDQTSKLSHPKVIVDDISCILTRNNSQRKKQDRQLTINELWKKSKQEGKLTVSEDRNSLTSPSRNNIMAFSVQESAVRTPLATADPKRSCTLPKGRKRVRSSYVRWNDSENENPNTPTILRTKQTKLEKKTLKMKCPSVNNQGEEDTKMRCVTFCDDGSVQISKTIYNVDDDIIFLRTVSPIDVIRTAGDSNRSELEICAKDQLKPPSLKELAKGLDEECTGNELQESKIVHQQEMRPSKCIAASDPNRVEGFDENCGDDKFPIDSSESSIHLSDIATPPRGNISLKQNEKLSSNSLPSHCQKTTIEPLQNNNHVLPSLELDGESGHTKIHSRRCTVDRTDIATNNKQQQQTTNNRNSCFQLYDRSMLFASTLVTDKSTATRPRAQLPSALTQVIEEVLQEKGCGNGFEQCQGLLSQQMYLPSSLLREIITTLQRDCDVSTMMQAHGILQQFKFLHPPHTIRQVYKLALQYPVVSENGEDDGVVPIIELIKTIIREVLDNSQFEDTTSVSTRYLASKQLLCFISSALEEDLSYYKSNNLAKNNLTSNPLIWEIFWEEKGCDCHCSNVDDILQLWIDSLQTMVLSMLTPLIKMIADCCAIFDTRNSSNQYGTASNRLVHLIASKLGAKYSTVHSVALRTILSQLSHHWLALRLADHLICCYDFSTLDMGSRQYLHKPLGLEKVLRCYCMLYPSEVKQNAAALENIHVQTTVSTSSSLDCETRKFQRDKSKVNKRNIKGETKLHLACIKNHPDKIRELLSLGADPNATDHAGWTPLHEACNHGNLDCVRELLKHKDTDLFTVGPNGFSVLHDAVVNNRTDVARLLVNSGGQKLLDLKSSDGFTATEICTTKMMSELISCSSQRPTTRRRRVCLPDHVVDHFFLLVMTLIRGCYFFIGQGCEVDPVHIIELFNSFEKHIKGFCTAKQLRKHRRTLAIIKKIIVN